MVVSALKSVPVLLAVLFALSSCGEDLTAADADARTPQLVLDCGESQPLGTDLRVPGPGRATPEKAVAPYAEGMDLVAGRSDDGTAVVFGVSDGEVVRQWQTSEHSDGWWPDGYTECTRR